MNEASLKLVRLARVIVHAPLVTSPLRGLTDSLGILTELLLAARCSAVTVCSSVYTHPDLTLHTDGYSLLPNE